MNCQWTWMKCPVANACLAYGIWDSSVFAASQWKITCGSTEFCHLHHWMNAMEWNGYLLNLYCGFVIMKPSRDMMIVLEANYFQDRESLLGQDWFLSGFETSVAQQVAYWNTCWSNHRESTFQGTACDPNACSWSIQNLQARVSNWNYRKLSRQLRQTFVGEIRFCFGLVFHSWQFPYSFYSSFWQLYLVPTYADYTHPSNPGTTICAADKKE